MRHTIGSAIASLSRKRDCLILDDTNVIQILKDGTGLGNGSWGMIDYLKRNGFRVMRTKRFKKEEDLFAFNLMKTVTN